MIIREIKWITERILQRHVIIDTEINYFPVLIFYGFPYRKSFKGRERQLPYAIGITNYFHTPNGIRYTWFIDIDNRLPRELVKYSILIVKTQKGFHAYLDIIEPTFIKAMKAAYRWHKTYGDMGQLRLALKREPHVLVVRIFGKYREPLKIIHERQATNPELEEWRKNVVDLILKLNTHY
jgi:hypothetical protein